MDWSGPIEIESSLDGTVRNAGVPRYDALDKDHLTHQGSGAHDDGTIWLVVETNESHIRIAESARLRVIVDGASTSRWSGARSARERHAAEWVGLELVANREVVLEKTVAIATSRDPGIYEPLGRHR